MSCDSPKIFKSKSRSKEGYSGRKARENAEEVQLGPLKKKRTKTKNKTKTLGFL